MWWKSYLRVGMFNICCKNITSNKMSVVVAQSVKLLAGLTYVFAKEGRTEFKTSWLQEILFSKELTDNYW